MTEQPDSVALNRHQFSREAERLSGFRRLGTILNAEAASAVAGLVFDAEVRDAEAARRYIVLQADERRPFFARIDALLNRECDQILVKQAYVLELLEAAQAGKLRARLAAMAEPDSAYAPGRMPRAGPEREVAKAAAWAGRSMHGDGPRLALEILTRHVLAEPAGNALGRTPALLDGIHAEVAAGAPRVRGPKAHTPYPSSIGGRYLLEQVFAMTAGTHWPPKGDPSWIDAALFYLGALTTVQGYPDGNKRTGRLAYAITLLKGGRPFVAPDVALEAELIRMRAADHS